MGEKCLADSIKAWAKKLKCELTALYLAYRDPRMNWWRKVLPFLVIAYAVSPVDFIPDFIPILGLLDDALLLPVGIWLCIRIIPNNIWLECRGRAGQGEEIPRQFKTVGILLVIAFWAVILILFFRAVFW